MAVKVLPFFRPGLRSLCLYKVPSCSLLIVFPWEFLPFYISVVVLCAPQFPHLDYRWARWLNPFDHRYPARTGGKWLAYDQSLSRFVPFLINRIQHTRVPCSSPTIFMFLFSSFVHLERCRTESGKSICPLIDELLYVQRSTIQSSVHSWIKPQQLILCKTQRRWLSGRVTLPVKETEAQSQTWEDPTCHGATNPVHPNYWACALEPRNCSSWAHVPQLLKPVCPKPVLPNRRPPWEAPTLQLEKSPSSNKDPLQPKINHKK